MALVLSDRVQETTATTGTGSITLGGAVSGYQSFAVVGNGNTCYYTIVNGSAWEVGIGTYSTTGPTLARTTVLANSSGNTSPITLAGASSVFLTYPAEKSVNLDASGNVSALGTISSGVWNGSTIGTAYGGTGVTSSSGANSNVLRDANQNVVANNFLGGYNVITAAAGTTVLTVASAYYQRISGSTTQTIQLPDATTLVNGQGFTFDNDSSGTVTIVDNASTVIDTVPSGAYSYIFVESNATSAGSWGKYALLPASYDFSSTGANFGGATLSNGTWQGNTIAAGYGGTGLSSFVAANNAIYSSSSTTLTVGTLPVAAGGTGITSLTLNYIPVGNGTSGFTSSSSLQFASGVLVVGGSSVLGGATNPITAFTGNTNNYIQTYVYNQTTGISGSADFVAYSNNSTDAHGWADLGFTSSTYADPVYTVTGPNEAYLLGSALNSSFTGNLVYATDSTGSANAHQWYVGGFTQAKSAWKMQLTSTGLQLATALGTAYGGTGNTAGQAVSVANAHTAGTGLSGSTFNGSAAVTWTLATSGVSAASYTNASITVDTYGRITSASSGAAPVTSIAVTAPVASTGGATPTISLASAYGDTQNPYGSKTANFFLAAPNGSAGAPTFRAIVAADIPTLNQNTTGSAASATNATYATSAGSATNAGAATNATYATSAGSATNATTATNQSGGTVNATTGAFSGNVTVTGTGVASLSTSGDITAYRSGGTTGVIFLDSSGTKYVYWNGTQYNMPGGQLYVNGSLSLNAGNYNSYSPSLTGSGASGTWSINVTGSAASATNATYATSAGSATNASAATNATYATSAGSATNATYATSAGSASSASSTTLLAALGNYVWSASTLPPGYSQGIQASFVQGANGWQSYGTVITANTYTGGGGALQMYVPYSPTYGGTGMQVRFGNYDVSGGNSWTAWKTLLASDNYTSYSPSLTGSGASGTWSINVTGSAASATNATYATSAGSATNASYATNASNLGGYPPNQTAGAYNIVQRDVNGYIQNNYFYTSGGGAERNASGMGYFAGFNSSDYYIRSFTPAAVAAAISGQSMNISGSATNATFASSATNATYATSAGSATNATFASSATNASAATYATVVAMSSARTDATAYPIVWGTTGSSSQLYSASACTITSSTGQISASILYSSGNVTAYSDERVKTNWRGYAPDFVEQLAKLLSGTYDRVDKELTQDGVGAQSLRPLLPNSVVEDLDGNLSVNYGGAAMVSAVELAKRVVDQEARITKLEALVAKFSLKD